MCGIFGLVATESSGLSKMDFEKSIRLLIKLSERRGRESSGLAVSANESISIFKQATKPSAMLKSKRFGQFLKESLARNEVAHSEQLAMPIAAIGHTRLVTNGTQAIPENNQPIVNSRLVGVHNGIVTNTKEILELSPELRALSYIDSDSEILFGLIDKYARADILQTAIHRTFQEIEGSASIAFFCNDLPIISLATNTGSLYYCTLKSQGLAVFGSERFIVEDFLRKTSIVPDGFDDPVLQLPSLNGVLLYLNDVEADVFSLGAPLPVRNERPLQKRDQIYAVVDHSQSQENLRRCTRCVLPETYPFISFDDQGVCNYCNNYEKQTFLGRDALEEILSKYRSKNGEPDCILGFSGGRDSCYALHILKNEYGMNPIAYTYDWAMVTDLARRNQAKVTGKLGVELIIRAADIHTKRRYIRKNIYAWLKRPQLGVVPLFMAGDKMFYYYGRQLRQETGIKLTIFGAGQQFEQMEFKTGFCGVDQTLQNNTKLYHFDGLNKLRLALWYSKEYLLNPSYINESLFDSIFAFYASFINKDDYLYLYRYIPWDEKEIEHVLKSEYGWESDAKFGHNQWRMGDGHTAFIDYIYYTIAGFSEFDVFRSHQIRQDVLSRDEAIELIKKDNQPRVQMLQDFSQLIGFNLEEVLLKINEIPKLY